MCVAVIAVAAAECHLLPQTNAFEVVLQGRLERRACAPLLPLLSYKQWASDGP